MRVDCPCMPGCPAWYDLDENGDLIDGLYDKTETRPWRDLVYLVSHESVRENLISQRNQLFRMKMGAEYLEAIHDQEKLAASR